MPVSGGKLVCALSGLRMPKPHDNRLKHSKSWLASKLINVKNVLGGFIHLLDNIILGICIAQYKFLCNKTPYSSKSDEANDETKIYKIFRVTMI